MKFTYQPHAKPVDGYTIQRGIHRGGFGEVYYALSDAGKEVALKLLTHDLDTELRGIRQCLNLKHSNLVTIFDVRTDGDGDQWVIMEYMQGASLDDVLAAFPQGLPVAEVHEWLSGICSGVEYLHDRGIVHRDLKPANVYRENGVVKIGDVGLSKRMGGDRRSQHTESVGTVYYMAPEVAQGKYGPGVDVYSLGVMAYEMLTGRLPFDGETTGEILMKHLTLAPDLKLLPEALRAVIGRALEKDPHKRTAAVRQFAEELRRAVNGVAVSALQTAEVVRGNGRPSGKSGFAPSTAFTPIPESAFIPPAPPPPVKRDTDRAHDTSRRPPPRPTATRAGHTVHRSSESSKPSASLHQKLLYWLPWIAAVAAFFIPWTKMSPHDIGETVGMIGFWGVVLYALVWWSTPPEERVIYSAASVEPGLLPPMTGVSFAEQLSGSLLLGTFLSGGLTYACLLGMGWFEPQWLNGLSPNAMTLLVGVAAISTASVLGVSQSWQLKGESLPHPRSTMAGIGAALGAAAFAADRFLLAQFPDLHDSSQSVFRHLGAHDLWLDHQPTVVSYMVFFAATLGLQNWRKLLGPYRRERLRWSAIVAAGVIGWLVSMFFGVPRPYAVVWAVAITAAAQLAAPWQPDGNVRKVHVKTA